MPSLIHTPTNTILIKHIRIADHFFSRLKGLMFTQCLELEHGLLIRPCQQIHTHFMRYSIDAIFVNGDHKVIHVERHLPPWRFTKYYKNAKYVVELPAGVANIVKLGDTLTVVN